MTQKKEKKTFAQPLEKEILYPFNNGTIDNNGQYRYVIAQLIYALENEIETKSSYYILK